MSARIYSNLPEALIWYGKSMTLHDYPPPAAIHLRFSLSIPWSRHTQSQVRHPLSKRKVETWYAWIFCITSFQSKTDSVKPHLFLTHQTYHITVHQTTTHISASFFKTLCKCCQNGSIGVVSSNCPQKAQNTSCEASIMFLFLRLSLVGNQSKNTLSTQGI